MYIILDNSLGPDNEAGVIFFENRYLIDQYYIEIRSIDVSFFEKKLSNLACLDNSGLTYGSRELNPVI